MGISIEIDHGPVDPISIGDFYTGKDLPLSLAMFLNDGTTCPTTKKRILQRDNQKVFWCP